MQMIINCIESGEHNEALLKAVDLLDTISGKASPYTGVTDEAIGFQPHDLRLKDKASEGHGQGDRDSDERWHRGRTQTATGRDRKTARPV